MNMSKKLWLLAAFVAPALALADEPAPQAQPFATLEAVLEQCARLLPTAADRFREQAKLLTQGASEEALNKVRKSEEYQAARDSTLESLAKVGEKDSKKACEQHLAPSQ